MLRIVGIERKRSCVSTIGTEREPIDRVTLPGSAP